MFKKPNVAPTLQAFDNGLMVAGDNGFMVGPIEYETQVVNEFTHNNRKCVVVRIQLPGVSTYHNGYVECNEDFYGDIIGGEEITYQGPIDDDGNCYIGFDTCHYYNLTRPETQTAGYVKSRCQEIAYQLGKLLQNNQNND
ncbi:hypothetical protein LCGC14_0548680 [marine sediment metagenome]|uniref:Uncharacterized protein n=1 Tax=marine sediment metagenome TaxID=412755 RepID=A0A0F9UYW3_9ZZZZ